MYVRVESGGRVQPYSLRRLKEDNPNRMFARPPSADVLRQYSVYEVVETEKPEIDPRLEWLEERYSLTGDSVERVWDVVPRPLDEAKTAVSAAIAKRRYQTESAGVYWSAPDGRTYYLDTTPGSQARFSAACTAMLAGIRQDGGEWVWKCADVSSGQPVVVFRPTSNAELEQWASLVHTHVQKCFEAEANAVAAVDAATSLDDLRQISFDTEFAAL